MKDKHFIYYGNPCIMRLTDHALQTFEDAQAAGPSPCPLYSQREECSPPDFACVQLSGAAMARYVLQFYSEATDDTLAIEREEFRKRAPLPPQQVKAYVDVDDNGVRYLSDPEEVVKRVWEYARAVLDLKPGERVFRSPEELWAPPAGIESLEAAARSAKPPANA